MNAYVGNFDFSDVKQRAILFGFNIEILNSLEKPF
jgi:hypothetical protein